MRKPLFGPSLEMIAFQSTVFGEMLTGIVEDIRSDVKSGKLKTVEQMEKALGAISRLIKSQTNLTIKMKYLDKKPDTGYAGILLPVVSLNHIFNRYVDIVEYVEKRDTDAIVTQLKKFKDEGNWIDTKNVKVNGAYASIESIMYLGSDYFLKDTCTPEETVAIILHEIGHHFYSLEYLDRASTTNQMLAGFAMEEFQHLPPGKRKVVFQKAETALQKNGLKALPLDQLADAKSPAETSTIFLSSVFDDARSHTDTQYYDYRACEALADNFCARHGFAKHMVTALAKLSGDFNKSLYKTAALAEYGGLVSALVIGPILMIGGSVASAGTLPIIMGLYATLSGFFTFTASQTMMFANNQELYHSYDDLKVRLQRLREQVIMQLKSHGNKKIFSKLLKDIDEMGKIIDETPLPPPTLITRLFEYFDSSRRQARDYRALQRLLEEFAANDLFVKAAKLQSI